MNRHGNIGQLKMTVFFGLLAVILGKVQFDLPGALGVKSNFAEIGFIASLPFIDRLPFALLVSCFSVFNVAPEGSLFPESFNHVAGMLFLFFTYRRISCVERSAVFIPLAGIMITLYYFALLLPLIFILHFLAGSLSLPDVARLYVETAPQIVYEWMITTALSILYFLLVRANDRKNTAQFEVLRVNEELRETIVALRASEQRYVQAIAATSDALWEWNLPTGETYFSSRWYEMLGYQDKAWPMNVNTWIELCHPDDLPSANEQIEKLLCSATARGYAIEFRMRTSSGNWRWLLGRGNVVERDAKGHPIKLSGTNTDITERKLAEEALRRSEEKLTRLFRLSPDAIVLINLESEQIQDANEMFMRVFGYERESILGRSTKDIQFYVTPENRDFVFAKLRNEGHLESLEIEFRRNDGSTVLCSMSSQILELDGALHVLSIVRDITEIKRLQDMMIQTEKMISVGGIAAGIAHEINNPLGIIMQGVQNIRQRMRPDFNKNIQVAGQVGLSMEALTRYVHERKLDVFIEDIEVAANRSSDIIRHMLDFSRRSGSKRKVCDLTEIIEKALTLASSDYDLKKSYDFRHIKIDREYGDDLPAINCTETEIEQVLLNILRNSAQAMAACSPPVLSPCITIRIAAQDESVRLEVTDNGPGMPPEVLRRIFEPFFTTKSPGIGTGLGLSVSYFIITNGHGGKMSVSSRLGEGTTFVVELPIEQEGGA